jgi:hypothetical protein
VQDLDKKSVTFRGEDSSEMRVYHSNRGDPFREGIEVSLDLNGGERGGYVFLEEREALALRDLLNRLYPPRQS